MSPSPAGNLIGRREDPVDSKYYFLSDADPDKEEGKLVDCVVIFMQVGVLYWQLEIQAKYKEIHDFYEFFSTIAQ